MIEIKAFLVEFTKNGKNDLQICSLLASPVTMDIIGAQSLSLLYWEFSPWRDFEVNKFLDLFNGKPLKFWLIYHSIEVILKP